MIGILHKLSNNNIKRVIEILGTPPDDVAFIVTANACISNNLGTAAYVKDLFNLTREKLTPNLESFISIAHGSRADPDSLQWWIDTFKLSGDYVDSLKRRSRTFAELKPFSE